MRKRTCNFFTIHLSTQIKLPSLIVPIPTSKFITQTNGNFSNFSMFFRFCNYTYGNTLLSYHRIHQHKYCENVNNPDNRLYWSLFLDIFENSEFREWTSFFSPYLSPTQILQGSLIFSLTISQDFWTLANKEINLLSNHLPISK